MYAHNHVAFLKHLSVAMTNFLENHFSYCWLSTSDWFSVPTSVISQSNWLHVVIFWFGYINLEVYSAYSSKLNSNFREVSNFHQLFLNLNRFHL